MEFPNALPILTTTRLTLRAMRPDDAPAIFEMFSHPDVMRYWSSLSMQTLGEAQSYIEHMNAYITEHDALTWGLARQTDDTLIGMATLFSLSPQNRRAEMGYALTRSAWGQGYMHEALTALVAYAFGPLDLIRIEADIDPRNTASQRALERLGFIQEGLLRDRWIVNGEISDTGFYGLLRRDWGNKG
jgi:RimJ/RimL family protein N-acetyltransferase